MKHSKEITDLVSEIKLKLSINFDNVKADIKDYVVNFKTYDSQICQVKIATLKDTLKTGELPTTIKRLMK